MSTTVSASDTPAQVLISENGAPGDKGLPGDNATGLNDIRKSLLDNPLLHIFKTNALTTAIAPTGTDADLTWTRATTATYVDRYGVVQTAAINTSREELEGFLNEDASTNDFLWSEDFSNAAWNKLQQGAGIIPAVTSDFGVSPDGAMTADRVVFDTVGSASGDISEIQQLLASSDSISSFYLKSLTVDGTIEVVTGGLGSKLVNITTEWTRVTGLSGVGTDIRLRAEGGVTSEQLDLLVWGAQDETGGLSSYIPTAASASSRSADNASVNYYDNVIFESPFTYFTSFSRQTDFDSDMGLFSNSGANRPLFRLRSSGQLQFLDDVLTISTATGVVTIGESTIGLVYDGTDLIFYVNGTEVFSSAYTPQITTALASVSFGSFTNGTFNINGHLKDTRFYTFALNADEVSFLS